MTLRRIALAFFRVMGWMLVDAPRATAIFLWYRLIKPLGKFALINCAIWYVLTVNDLQPDSQDYIGWVDDFIVITVFLGVMTPKPKAKKRKRRRRPTPVIAYPPPPSANGTIMVRSVREEFTGIL